MLWLMFWLALIAFLSTPLPSHERITALLAEPVGATGADVSKTDVRSFVWLMRKTAHPVVYGVLAILVIRFLAERNDYHAVALPLRLYIQAFVICVVVALLDEGHQLLIDSRTGSLSDVGLDAVGAFGALLLYREFRGPEGRIQSEPEPIPKAREHVAG